MTMNLFLTGRPEAYSMGKDGEAKELIESF
jgi:hypothetical protein